MGLVTPVTGCNSTFLGPTSPLYHYLPPILPVTDVTGVTGVTKKVSEKEVRDGSERVDEG